MFIDNFWYDAQFKRTIGHVVHGGADLGECLILCDKLNEADFDTWYQVWFDLANKNVQLATQYEALNQSQNAYGAYLRASNYFRTSFFFLDKTPFDERIRNAYDNSVSCFLKALSQSELRFEAIRIPFENIELPGYLFGSMKK